MVYVPDPTDPSRPTLPDPAGTAAEEFRKLKAYIQTLSLASGNRMPGRQQVLSGLLDTNNNAAYLGISATPLGVDLLGGTIPLVTSYASGFDASGALDVAQVIGSDLANFFPGLNVSNTTYLALDYVSASVNPTPVKILAPPQYGEQYDRTKQTVLQFGGVPLSTVFLDDFGNGWGVAGGARVQANQVKFGSGALGGQGVNNVLNGANDYIATGQIKSMGVGSWAIRAWCYPTVLPGAGNLAVISSGVNAGNFGAVLSIYNNAGTIRFGYFLSSNGTSFNIANGTQGTTLPVVNTWYFVELTFDALAGVYRLYVNGVQEASTASTLKICSLTSMGVGANSGVAGNYFTGYIDKFEFLPYCQHPAGTAYAVPTGAPSITVVGYASDWFDINTMTLKQVSAASTAASTNPSFTPKRRLYVGETDTSGVAVTAVRAQAVSAQFIGNFITPLPGTAVTTAARHAIGTELIDAWVEVQCLTSEQSYAVGEIVQIPATGGGGANIFWPITAIKDKTFIQFITGNTTAFVLGSRAAGVPFGLSSASWAYRVRAKRLF